ncbi:MAG: 2-oxoglutarate and iron-dependent oxygenase domain-containing protein, partial [Bacteroidia bacterium]|nr:2-oxoglutarate and iron-dependent oxygenase domain-containing protein [Bacteroidia bacterium]
MIPSIDLRDFLSGNPEKKDEFVQSLGKAYQEIGFVAVKGHLLNEGVSENLYDSCKSFFSLSDEEKKAYEVQG